MVVVLVSGGGGRLAGWERKIGNFKKEKKKREKRRWERSVLLHNLQLLRLGLPVVVLSRPGSVLQRLCM